MPLGSEIFGNMASQAFGNSLVPQITPAQAAELQQRQQQMAMQAQAQKQQAQVQQFNQQMTIAQMQRKQQQNQFEQRVKLHGMDKDNRKYYLDLAEQGIDPTSQIQEDNRDNQKTGLPPTDPTPFVMRAKLALAEKTQIPVTSGPGVGGHFQRDDNGLQFTPAPPGTIKPKGIGSMALVPPEIQKLMANEYQSVDDFMADVEKSPSTLKLLQQITSYKTDAGRGLNPAVKLAYVTAASVFDPNFDPSRYQGIEKAKTDLQNPDSKTGQNVTALNTVLSHLDTLNKQFTGLQKDGKLTDSPVASAFNLWYSRNIAGDPLISQTVATELPVVTELDKALSNTSVQERIRQYQDVLRKYGLSDKQAFGMVNDFAGLVNKRLTVNQQRYENALADSGVQPGDLRRYFWTPEGKASYDDIMSSGQRSGAKDFQTEAEAAAAAAQGQIRPGDAITVGGRSATWQ